MTGNYKALFLKPGAEFRHHNSSYKVEAMLGIDHVLAVDIATGEYRHLNIENITPISEDVDTNANKSSSEIDLNAWSEEDWLIAQHRLEVITPLLKNTFRTKKDVEDVAGVNEVSVATIYNWMKAYTEERHVSSLIPAPRGVKDGSRRINKAIEAIVDGAINEFYLSNNRYKASQVIEEINTQCKIAGYSPPHPNTVRNRIKAIPQRYVLRARGKKDEARDTYDPIRGQFPGADYPLAVVQIDHTPGDVIIVDDDYRLPVGRPWVTLSIDVFTRMVTGYYISPESPSALSTGMCVSRSILGKKELLATFDLPGDWPVWGKMSVLHADNGKDFRGHMLRRACEQHQIDLQLRPVKVPHYGGHIERLMGTTANETHTWPGTTFSNTEDRKGYNSEKMATMTMTEFEAQVLDFIVNKYHVRKHSALGMPPIKKWELGILGDGNQPGIGAPLPVERPDKLKLDFMPFFERTVQRYGIQIDDVHYYHESLSHWINTRDPNNPKAKRKFIVRRDPRDISKIYFFDPQTKEYYTIPYRNMAHPAVNIWELKEAKKRLNELGDAAVDEDKLFETILRMRRRAEESAVKTKAARKRNMRVKTTNKIASITKPDPVSQSLDENTTDPGTSINKPFKNSSAEEEFNDLFRTPVDVPQDLDVSL